MYKEIKGLIAEMGITKEDIQNEIKSTIDSYVRSAMSENITNYVQDSVKTLVKNEIASSAWNKPSRLQEVMKDCLRDLVMRELNAFDLKISVTDKTE